MENAKKNLVFRFGGGRHASFHQKPVVNLLFCLGVGATCSQDSGQVLKTRLCGGPGLLNVQIDAAQTLTSVCGESNFQIVHTNMHLIFSFGKWKKKYIYTLPRSKSEWPFDQA